MKRGCFLFFGAAFAVAALPLDAASAADAVCAGTASQGLVCLVDGAVKSFPPGAGGLPRGRISDIAVCGGKMLLAIGSNVVTFDGSAFTNTNRVPRGFATRIACSGENGYWVSSALGAAHWNGSSWRHFDSKEIAKSERIVGIQDIAGTPDGGAWVTLIGSMAAHYDGKAWKIYKEGDGFDTKLYFSRIHVDRKGQVWLPTSRGMLSLRDGKWQNVSGPTSATSIAEDASGRLWLASGSRLTEFDGGRMTQHSAVNGVSIRAIAAAADGSIWVATEFGLARFADGQWQARQMHNSPLPTNDFVSIGVLGKGSAAPAEKEQAKGSLTLRIEWSDGKPVADAEVQICGISAGLIHRGGGPCAGRPLFTTAKTDAEGKIAFKNLAPASYRIAIKPQESPRWVLLLGTSERTQVAPGEDKNGGTLSLQTRFRDKK
ncbi:MAG: carboxypeptidase regulatory-like domain-containing protein [Rhodospirillaceae bacterium]|nr:carboxypeptidase regulatory-like domain-containing protein [Rhodospirillaceae bacterium]